MTDEERQSFRNKYGINAEEEKAYVLPEEKDYEILAKIKKIENNPLSTEDKQLVEFIRTQLFDDWRTPILEKLEEIEEKYK